MKTKRFIVFVIAVFVCALIFSSSAFAFPNVSNSNSAKRNVLCSVSGVEELGLSGRMVDSIAVDPKNPNIIYAGTDNGVFKTTDSGKKWTRVSNGLRSNWVHGIVIDSANPQVVYAGTDNGIFKSTDGGSLWGQLGLANVWIHTLVMSPKNPQVIYAGTDDGIYKTTNGGLHWNQITLSDNEIYSLSICKANTGIVYAGTGSEGVFVSMDGGDDWMQTSESLENNGVNAVAVNPGNPQVVYAGTDNGIFKSVNSGMDWSHPVLSNRQINALLIDPENPNIIFAGTDSKGLFESTDGGTNWKQVALSGSEVLSLAVNPKNSSIVYVGTNNGIFEFKSSEASQGSNKKSKIVITLKIDNPYMSVNGLKKEIDPGRGTKPVIIPKWGRTVVPIRAIVEALGGTIGWNGKERKVTINFKGTTIELWINNPRAKVNGETRWIDPNNHDVRPIIVNDRTMLPLRFVAESLGCKVEWDGTTRTITIVYPRP